jgi:hypothetical protein
MRIPQTAARAVLVTVKRIFTGGNRAGGRGGSEDQDQPAGGEQRKAEMGLGQRYFYLFHRFLHFESGTDEEKSSFERRYSGISLHRLLYMKFQFKESYGEIRKAQRILIDLYGKRSRETSV